MRHNLLPFFMLLFLLSPFLYAQEYTLLNSTLRSLEKLEEDYPSLKEQVLQCLKTDILSLDDEKAVSNLSDYIKNADEDVRKAMELLLQPGFFSHLIQTPVITVDGKDNDWKLFTGGSPFTITDRQGDSYKQEMSTDLISAAAFLDEELTLSLMLKTAGRPGLTSYFDFLIEMKGGEEYDYQVIVFGWDNGKIYGYCNDIESGQQLNNIRFEYAINDIVEASLCLEDLDRNINPNIKILARSFDREVTVIDDCYPIHVFTDRINYPLLLLLYLCENGCYRKDDSISVALSLANSYLFMTADDQTKGVVLTDIKDHFNFYQKIIQWHNDNDIIFNLKDQTIIPKIFWADRFTYYRYDILNACKDFNTGGKITIDIYTEFVDRIETLEGIHSIIREYELLKPGISVTAFELEDFVHRHRTYRSLIENLIDFNQRKMFTDEELLMAQDEINRGEYYREYFGRERRWDEFRWLNYQYGLYQKEGMFKGDCGDTTVIQMGFYRACGIPPVSFQWMHPEGIAAFSHNFPGYFNPLYKRWCTVQKPIFFDYGGVIAEPFDIYLYFKKPIWHPWLYTDYFYTETEGTSSTYYSPYYQGELTDTQKLFNFLSLGIENSRFEQVFLSEDTQCEGLFFNEDTAPAELLDADSDTLPDLLEEYFNLDEDSPDTDNDGYADAWEIDNGFDPASSRSPGELFPAIDGLSNRFEEENLFRLFDGEEDVKTTIDVFDIKLLSAKVYGDQLYIQVQYHNKVKDRRYTDCHSFYITVKNENQDKYWIQWYGSYLNFYKVIGPDFKDWQKLNTKGCFYKAVIESAEFFIPLKELSSGNVLYLQYNVSGYSADGTLDTVSDISGVLRVPVNEEDISFSLDNTLQSALPVTDREGDCRGVTVLKDIKECSCVLRGDLVFINVQFYNEIDKLPFGLHSLLIRGNLSRLNYWIQWWEVNGLGLYTWQDGENSRQQEIQPGDYDCIPYENGYVFVLPASLFKEEEILYIQYRFGGKDAADQYVSDADTIGKLRLVLRGGDIREEINRVLRRSESVTDPERDYSGVQDVYDLKQFSVKYEDGQIVCYAEFYNQAESMPFGIQTVYLRKPASKENWWIQYWALGHFGIWYWKDGENSKQIYDYVTEFDSLFYDNGYVFIIPGKLTGDGTVEVTCYTSGCDLSGECDPKSDGSEKVVIDIN